MNFYKEYLFYTSLILFSAILFQSCHKDPLIICETKDCEFSYLFPGMMAVYENIDTEYYFLTDSGLKKVEKESEAIPFAYDYKNKILASKSSDLDLINIVNENLQKRTVSKTYSLPKTVSTIFSGCFLPDNTLAVLLLDENEKLKRRYILSFSEGENISKWRSFLIKEENPHDFAASFLSLGAALERPYSIQCANSGNIYINTVTSFSDMLQLNIYKFDDKNGVLTYETGFHPLNVDGGVISVFYEEKTMTAYIYQNRELLVIKEMEFPVKTVFDQKGDVLFSPLTDEGLILYFVPESKENTIKKARIIKI